MKKILLVGALFCAGIFIAQKKDTYIKANALLLPVGVINAGVEHGFSEHITGQFDVFVSPWKSFAGHEMLFGIGTIEGRYYFDKAFSKWYVGANIGFGVFNFQKWNYWNDNFYVNKETQEVMPYRNNELYQKGFSYMIGATIGYQWQWKERWNIDMFLGVGSSQGFYKGYRRGLPETQENRYDSVENWDKSGEIIPYRGGVMISYKL